MKLSLLFVSIERTFSQFYAWTDGKGFLKFVVSFVIDSENKIH